MKLRFTEFYNDKDGFLLCENRKQFIIDAYEQKLERILKATFFVVEDGIYDREAAPAPVYEDIDVGIFDVIGSSLEKYGELPKKAVEQILVQLMITDPTTKKGDNIPPERIIDSYKDIEQVGKYTQWVINTTLKSYVTNGRLIHRFWTFITEDWTNVYDNLVKWNHPLVKNAIKDDEGISDINKINSFVSLANIVYPYRDIITQQEEITKATLDFKVLAGSCSKHKKLGYNEEDWFVVVPNTWEADRYFGADTEWCTAASNGKGTFEYYAKDGPLYILIDNEGLKYQFQFRTKQYRDRTDTEINPEEVLRHSPKTKMVLMEDYLGYLIENDDDAMNGLRYAISDLGMVEEDFITNEEVKTKIFSKMFESNQTSRTLPKIGLINMLYEYGNPEDWDKYVPQYDLKKSESIMMGFIKNFVSDLAVKDHLKWLKRTETPRIRWSAEEPDKVKKRIEIDTLAKVLYRSICDSLVSSSKYKENTFWRLYNPNDAVSKNSKAIKIIHDNWERIPNHTWQSFVLVSEYGQPNYHLTNIFLNELLAQGVSVEQIISSAAGDYVKQQLTNVDYSDFGDFFVAYRHPRERRVRGIMTDEDQYDYKFPTTSEYLQEYNDAKIIYFKKWDDASYLEDHHYYDPYMAFYKYQSGYHEEDSGSYTISPKLSRHMNWSATKGAKHITDYTLKHWNIIDNYRKYITTYDDSYTNRIEFVLNNFADYLASGQPPHGWSSSKAVTAYFELMKDDPDPF